MNKFDYLLIIGILSIFLVGIFSFQYYFKIQINECISDPLVYGAKQMEERFGREFLGSGFLRVERGQLPALAFNSTGSRWTYLPLG